MSPGIRVSDKSTQGRFIDISGDFDFSCLEIRPTSIPRFWYFYNSIERCFGNTFILTNQARVQKACRVSLISDGDNNLVPRFDFFTLDKKDGVISLAKGEGEETVKSKVNLDGDGSRSFWKLVTFLSTVKNISFDATEKYSILKSNAEVVAILNSEKASEILSLMGDEGVEKLNTIFGITKLENLLKKWNENKANGSEAFWQKEFEENPWVISQIFASPYIFIEETPYFGGKRTDGVGGTQGDLLYKNIKTNNAAFIEIKTPLTPLAKSLYRGKVATDNNAVYSMSEELSGGIVQVLNQRHMQLQKADALEADYKSFNSKCILIVGNTEQLQPPELKSFDLFRNSNKDVEIITFDELFERVNIMKEVFRQEGSRNSVLSTPSSV